MLQGEEAAPLFPHMSPQWPVCSQPVTSRCLPGRPELLTGLGPRLPGLSRAKAARCSQSTGQLPVSFTVSLQSRALLSHTRSNCSTFPGWCWGTSLVSDPISHPRAAEPEVEPDTAGLTTKSHSLQEMALKGGCGGTGGQNLAVPPGTGF